MTMDDPSRRPPVLETAGPTAAVGLALLAEDGPLIEGLDPDARDLLRSRLAALLEIEPWESIERHIVRVAREIGVGESADELYEALHRRHERERGQASRWRAREGLWLLHDAAAAWRPSMGPDSSDRSVFDAAQKLLPDRLRHEQIAALSAMLAPRIRSAEGDVERLPAACRGAIVTELEAAINEGRAAAQLDRLAPLVESLGPLSTDSGRLLREVARALGEALPVAGGSGPVGRPDDLLASVCRFDELAASGGFAGWPSREFGELVRPLLVRCSPLAGTWRLLRAWLLGERAHEARDEYLADVAWYRLGERDADGRAVGAWLTAHGAGPAVRRWIARRLLCRWNGSEREPGFAVGVRLVASARDSAANGRGDSGAMIDRLIETAAELDEPGRSRAEWERIAAECLAVPEFDWRGQLDRWAAALRPDPPPDPSGSARTVVAGPAGAASASRRLVLAAIATSLGAAALSGFTLYLLLTRLRVLEALAPAPASSRAEAAPPSARGGAAVDDPLEAYIPPAGFDSTVRALTLARRGRRLELELARIEGASREAQPAAGPGLSAEAPFLGVIDLGRTEVTRAQYALVLDQAPPSAADGELPVENVSWREAQEFCRRVKAALGREVAEVRLPMQHEWGFAAARGAVETTLEGARLDEPDRESPYPVRGSVATSDGVFDLVGNVAEWMQDTPEQARDREMGGEAVEPRDDAFRAFRGGDYRDRRDVGELWKVVSQAPGERFRFVGFRIVLVPRD